MDRNKDMDRRDFVLKLLSAATVSGGSSLAMAQANPMVNEADAQAANLNHKADAANVKRAKFKAGQARCNCRPLQGRCTACTKKA